MTLSNVAGSVSYGSLSLDFQLRDLVDYTDFTTLYDKYKLAFVKFVLYHWQLQFQQQQHIHQSFHNRQ